MWTTLTKLNVGEVISKLFLDGIVDNLMHLFGLAGSATLQAGANGSFENDTDGDTYPDSWTFAALTNGTGAIDSTDSSHGGKSFKFVRSLGVGNGGGTLTSDDYFECAANRRLVVQWALKCSAAGVRVKVEMLFFTRALAAVSTVSVYDSTANPTAWTYKTGDADPPATAYYAKLKITGGDTTADVAASIWFDDLVITPASRATGNHIVFTSSGTWNCRVPRARIRAWGAGGGGGGGSGGLAGGSGGGGEYAEAWVDTVPGTAYAVTCPAGGAGGTFSPGVNGGSPSDTSVGSLITAEAGNGGTRGESGGAGGGGGSAGTATFTLGGEAGGASAGGGGFSGLGGRGGITAGEAGRTPGGGGKGGAAGADGAAGGNARVVIDW